MAEAGIQTLNREPAAKALPKRISSADEVMRSEIAPAETPADIAMLLQYRAFLAEMRVLADAAFDKKGATPEEKDKNKRLRQRWRELLELSDPLYVIVEERLGAYEAGLAAEQKRKDALEKTRAAAETARLERERQLAADKAQRRAKAEAARIERETKLAEAKAESRKKSAAIQEKWAKGAAEAKAKWEATKAEWAAQDAAAKEQREAARLERDQKLAEATARREAAKLERAAQLAEAAAQRETARLALEKQLAETTARREAANAQREAAAVAQRQRALETAVLKNLVAADAQLMQRPPAAPAQAQAVAEEVAAVAQIVEQTAQPEITAPVAKDVLSRAGAEEAHAFFETMLAQRNEQPAIETAPDPVSAQGQAIDHAVLESVLAGAIQDEFDDLVAQSVVTDRTEPAVISDRAAEIEPVLLTASRDFVETSDPAPAIDLQPAVADAPVAVPEIIPPSRGIPASLLRDITPLADRANSARRRLSAGITGFALAAEAAGNHVKAARSKAGQFAAARLSPPRIFVKPITAVPAAAIALAPEARTAAAGKQQRPRIASVNNPPARDQKPKSMFTHDDFGRPRSALARTGIAIMMASPAMMGAGIVFGLIHHAPTIASVEPFATQVESSAVPKIVARVTTASPDGPMIAYKPAPAVTTMLAALPAFASIKGNVGPAATNTGLSYPQPLAYADTGPAPANCKGAMRQIVISGINDCVSAAAAKAPAARKAVVAPPVRVAADFRQAGKKFAPKKPKPKLAMYQDAPAAPTDNSGFLGWLLPKKPAAPYPQYIATRAPR